MTGDDDETDFMARVGARGRGGQDGELERGHGRDAGAHADAKSAVPPLVVSLPSP
jgi:hypothetical protein